MARYTGPKNRIARRFGVNIFGRARNPLVHKQNPPGQHGARHKKKSDFGMQLDEKQKLKAVYGMISNKQLVRYYKKSLTKTGNTAHNFLEMLECRLDNVVYRLKFASTIFAAHQLVAHGHVLVDGKKVDRRSFQVRPGMVISIKGKSQTVGAIQKAIESPSRSVPEYFESQPSAFTGKLIAPPSFEQISLPLPINLAVVCEYLAHAS
jgi:small subunit ribosomal protein S4